MSTTARGPGDGPVPVGTVCVLDPDVVSGDGGRILLGGSPAVMLVLRPAAVSRVVDGRVVVTDRVAGVLARRLTDRGLAHPEADPGLPGCPTAADVTVVVPVRDNPAGLARLLASLPPVGQVVVVDDGSSDPGPTARVVTGPGRTLLRHPTSRGPAAARNTGLREVRTDVVAFLDSDVVPDPGWLDPLLGQLADPLVGLVAPRIAGLVGGPPGASGASGASGPPAGTTAGSGWVAAYEHARSSLDLGPRPARVQPGGRVSYVPSAALVARVRALGDGFDETLRVAEDVDLLWRVHEQGWRCRYEPASTVRHDHRTRVGAWLRRKAFYGTGAAELDLRHPGQVPPLATPLWSALLVAALLAQRPWSVPVAVAVQAAATARLARRLRACPHPVEAAVRTAPRTTVGALLQTASALVRTWWPLSALACLVSRRARRAVLVAAVVDGVLDHRRTRPALDLPRYVLARRLDDLAYGWGVWQGCLRRRRPGPLLPRLR
ncbi:mycofactocin biosynthesis glycosyltransferase MftF [Aquipuribacter sp. MA13-6]|uniref:mycofactocin biosynthesis glycosyltransferase MftF n=1 Tax=unclassified Aquipuribacter TaxID=2635084 RepID=UPI003EEA4028